MLNFKKHVLDNGLTLLVVEDGSTPMVSLNTLYGVGSRDESPSRTGFAHLFEHLMFGGTPNVPDFDSVVTSAGGESNANTGNDFTQYYLTVPASYLETALWLESDRMHSLGLSQHSLDVQKSVVTEEYNYRYINQPYGDVWLHLRPLCYKVHPYRWCTIGTDIRHVAEAQLSDVEEFFNHYYRPNNAILAVVGNVKCDEVLRLVEKWYGDIPAGGAVAHNLPAEPAQNGRRSLSVRRDVPSDAIYMAYHSCGRLDADLEATDMISDILSNGKSARLYNSLVVKQRLFTEIDAYITGDIDPGLFVVSGRLAKGVNGKEAIQAVQYELNAVATNDIDEHELEKVKNKYESTFAYSQYKPLDCAQSLCYYQWLDRLELVNSEPQLYRRVGADDIHRVASTMFRDDNLSVLYYGKEEL